jgi:hypothetical protein
MSNTIDPKQPALRQRSLLPEKKAKIDMIHLSRNPNLQGYQCQTNPGKDAKNPARLRSKIECIKKEKENNTSHHTMRRISSALLPIK